MTTQMYINSRQTKQFQYYKSFISMSYNLFSHLYYNPNTLLTT